MANSVETWTKWGSIAAIIGTIGTLISVAATENLLPFSPSPPPSNKPPSATPSPAPSSPFQDTVSYVHARPVGQVNGSPLYEYHLQVKVDGPKGQIYQLYWQTINIRTKQPDGRSASTNFTPINSGDMWTRNIYILPPKAKSIKWKVEFTIKDSHGNKLTSNSARGS